MQKNSKGDYLMSIVEELVQDISKDHYFKELFLKTEKNYSFNFFNIQYPKLKEKEFIDLLRFADILSRSSDDDAKDRAYKILSLLVDKYHDNPFFRIFANSILVKLGNFPALKFLEDNFLDQNSHPYEIKLERCIKEEFQKIPSTNNEIFTDSQYKIFELLKNNNHFSFSGPTSLGKSFIVNAFVRHLISFHKGTDNIVILVPTRALINQTLLKLREKFSDIENYKILAHPTIPSYNRDENTRYIFIFTPERLIAYLSDNSNPKIDYLFIDEAQKIIAEKSSRSALYYHAILQAERKSIKLYFCSPNIPNPNIFLQIFEKSTDECLSLKNSPVSQNRFFLDLIDNKANFFSDLNIDNDEIVKIPLNFNKTDSSLKKSSDFFSWLSNLGEGYKNIIYCNTKADTVVYATEFAKTQKETDNEKINEVIKIIEEYLHPKYFLIDCLRKGVAFHFGNLPQRIREKVEMLFEDKSIPVNYIFCTSTLLEGVNLPAKNIFVLNNKIGNSKMKDIDFWNLAGRAGRLTKELSGNIICTRIEDKSGRWNNPEIDLKMVKNKEIKPFEPTFITGTQNFFENVEAALKGDKFTRKQISNEEIKMLNHYANIALIHEIRTEDSILRSNFIDRNKNAREVLKSESKKIKVPDKILSSSSMIKAKYQNRIYTDKFLKNYILSSEISFESVSESLKQLSDFYRWDTEESGGNNPLYKSSKKSEYPKIFGYYAFIMSEWMKSTPLSLMIKNSIDYHENRGVFWDNENKTIINFNKNDSKQINTIINDLISDIENILRFKLKNYYQNYYAILKDRLGEENAGADWAEFLEYGTSDPKTIELQNIGIPRHLAKFLLENYSKYFVFEHNILMDLKKDNLLSSMNKNSIEYKELIEYL